jgi:hypothetical protein
MSMTTGANKRVNQFGKIFLCKQAVSDEKKEPNLRQPV